MKCTCTSYHMKLVILFLVVFVVSAVILFGVLSNDAAIWFSLSSGDDNVGNVHPKEKLKHSKSQCVVDAHSNLLWNRNHHLKQGWTQVGHKYKPCAGNTCPNILYLLVDDMGYGDVRYNGGRAYTPNLDAMASGPHSIQFNRFYSGGPTCSPTRGTLLTGRNHNRYCIWHADLGNPKVDLTCPSLGPLPSSEVTVAEMLQDVGYHTSIYGKWHIGDLKAIEGGNSKWPVSHPGMNGFRDWLVTERHTSTLLPNCACSKCPCTYDGQHYHVYFCRNYWGMNSDTGKLEKYPMQVLDDSHFLVDLFEDFLKNRNASIPFFTILAFHSVHSQYLATPRWLKFYKDYTVSTDKKHYLGTLSGLDEAIGRVRRLLQLHGVYNNTMLWFSSDNGPQKGEPGSTGGLYGRKGSVWEGGIRVPGIIEWPAVITENRKSSVPVVTSDLLPTVADIVGLDIPHHITLDGISILPILQNRRNYRGKNINFAFHIHQGNLNSKFSGATIGDRYKYHAAFDRGKMEKFYLFDLMSDRTETVNVSSAHINETLSMKAELEHFLKSVTKSAKEVGCMKTHDRRFTHRC